MTIREAMSAVQQAWVNLKEHQKHATELRSKWLKSVARQKAAIYGDTNAQKTLQNMLRQLHDSQMHRKLTYITKGAHSGLNYIDKPTSDWYYSDSEHELHHYESGVFQAHAAI